MTKADGTHKLPLRQRRALERKLIRAYRAGDSAAGDKLIAMHSGYLWQWVHRYCRSAQNGMLDKDDLYQEAACGLLHAASLHDGRRDCGLLAYAKPWIRVKLQRAIHRHRRVVAIPVIWHQRHAVSIDDMSLDASIVENDRKSRQRIDELQAPVVDIFGVLQGAEQRAYLRCLLRRLRPQQRSVIILRYGLGPEPPMTNTAIGKMLGVSRERIRQIYVCAMARLLHLSKIFPPADGLL